MEDVAHLDPGEALRLFDELGSDFLSVHDAEGTYLYASKASKRMFGWEPEELLGRSAYAFFHPEDIERIRRDHAKHQQAKPGAVLYRLRCEDGRWRWVETRSQAQSSGSTIVAITRDVHLQVLAEQRRRAVVESMAGAVAHEVSNPLTIAGLRLPEGPEAEDVRRALQRISVFLRELRLIGRDLGTDPQPLDLRDELRKVQGTPSPQPGEPLVVHAPAVVLRQLLFLLAYDPWGEATSPLIGRDSTGVWIRLRFSESGGNAVHADLRFAMEGTVKMLPRVQQVRELAAELGIGFENGEGGVCTLRFPEGRTNPNG